MEFDVAYLDMEGLYEDLQAAMGSKADEVFEEIIEKLAEEVRDLAQEYAPVDTGELQRSIEIERTNKLEREIVAKAEHAVYMEYGTGLRGEYPGTEYVIEPRNASALAFDMNGSMVFATHVIHPGVAPRPFMRPALLTAVEPLEELLFQGAIKLIIDTPNAHKAGNERQQYDKIELPDEYAPDVAEAFETIDPRGVQESSIEQVNKSNKVTGRRTGRKR